MLILRIIRRKAENRRRWHPGLSATTPPVAVQEFLAWLKRGAPVPVLEAPIERRRFAAGLFITVPVLPVPCPDRRLRVDVSLGVHVTPDQGSEDVRLRVDVDVSVGTHTIPDVCK